MKRIILILLASLSIVILGFQSSSAQTKRESHSQFKISKNGLEVSDYKKMVLIIELDEYSDEDMGAGNIGLTEEMLRTESESHLTQAGLEMMPGFNRSEYLYIHVGVKYNRSFYILMQFNRPVLYQVRERQYMKYGAKIWQGIRFGQHGYTPKYIMECLNELLEGFINEYLKANTE